MTYLGEAGFLMGPEDGQKSVGARNKNDSLFSLIPRVEKLGCAVPDRCCYKKLWFFGKEKYSCFSILTFSNLYYFFKWLVNCYDIYTKLGFRYLINGFWRP